MFSESEFWRRPIPDSIKITSHDPIGTRPWTVVWLFLVWGADWNYRSCLLQPWNNRMIDFNPSCLFSFQKLLPPNPTLISHVDDSVPTHPTHTWKVHLSKSFHSSVAGSLALSYHMPWHHTPHLISDSSPNISIFHSLFIHSSMYLMPAVDTESTGLGGKVLRICLASTQPDR